MVVSTQTLNLLASNFIHILHCSQSTLEPSTPLPLNGLYRFNNEDMFLSLLCHVHFHSRKDAEILPDIYRYGDLIFRSYLRQLYHLTEYSFQVCLNLDCLSNSFGQNTNQFAENLKWKPPPIPKSIAGMDSSKRHQFHRRQNSDSNANKASHVPPPHLEQSSEQNQPEHAVLKGKLG